MVRCYPITKHAIAHSYRQNRSFLGQVPVFVAAIAICWVIFRSLEAKEIQADTHKPASSNSVAANMARIDFLGAGSLGLGLLFLMLPLEIGGQKVPWSHPILLVLVALGLAMLGLFIAAETRWAKEPIFPLRLLKSRDALLCYFITGCILAAQSGVSTCFFSSPRAIFGNGGLTMPTDDFHGTSLLPSHGAIV